MKQYKKGDKVRVISKSYSHGFTIPSTGIIEDIDSSNYVFVNVKGHVQVVAYKSLLLLNFITYYEAIRK